MIKVLGALKDGKVETLATVDTVVEAAWVVAYKAAALGWGWSVWIATI